MRARSVYLGLLKKHQVAADLAASYGASLFTNDERTDYELAVGLWLNLATAEASVSAS